MPSKNASRLCRSLQIKGHKQLSPFLCWSPPISADSSQPLTVEIFIFPPLYNYLGPCLLIISSASSFAEHSFDDPVGTGHSPTPHTPWALGLSIPGTTVTWWKLLFIFPIHSVLFYNPQRLLSHRHPLSLVTIVHWLWIQPLVHDLPSNFLPSDSRTSQGAEGKHPASWLCASRAPCR